MKNFKTFLAVLILVLFAQGFGVAATSEYYDLASKYYKDGEYIKAFDGFKKAAEQGDARADFELGVMYLYGRGAVLSDEMAFAAFQKSAGKGNVGGIFMLGRMYIEGIGTKQNIDKAINLYTQAAGEGNPFFQYLLGEYYLKGKFVKQNVNKALELLRKAADGGSGYAALLLAEVYESNAFGVLDGEKSAKYYLYAAELGMPKALLVLGDVVNSSQKRLASGGELGDESDDMWILRKAGEGDTKALYELAQVYNHIKTGKTFNWSRGQAKREALDMARGDEVTVLQFFQDALLPLIILNILVILLFSWFNVKQISEGRLKSLKRKRKGRGR